MTTYSETIDTIKELNKIINVLRDMQTETNREMSEIDKEITDIEHAAEFYNLNAAQGYKLYKMLHDARVKRREIKNKHDILQWVMSKKVEKLSNNVLNNQMCNIKARIYVPRVLKELFDM